MTQALQMRWDESLPPFVGPGSDLPEVGYAIEAVADGTNTGNPEALFEIVKSLIDGSHVELEGWDNREAPIRLRVSAPTRIAGPALAEAEKALMLAAQATQKAPLVYVPAAQDSATCVFDVVAAKLERDTRDDWDLEEELREYRFYLLTLTCRPFVHPEQSIIAPAIAPDPAPGTPPVVVDIDTCASFSGWTAAFEYMSSTSSGSAGGYVHGTGTRSSSLAAGRTKLTRTGSVTMGSTPLLVVDVSTTGALDFDVQVEFKNGPQVTLASPMAFYPSPIAGTRYIYQPPPIITSMAFKALTSGGGATSLRVHNIARTDKLDSGGSTTRQRPRTVKVEGSAPTEAAVRLFDATPAALGSEILVYTSANTTWSPPLRQFRVSSSLPVADAARISGSRIRLDAPVVFNIPANLLTEGTYALTAQMQVLAEETIGWSARMVSSTGAAIPGSSVTISGSVKGSLENGSNYGAVQLGVAQLPVLQVEGNQMVELTLTGSANMWVDEVWLFGLHDGVLTWLTDADSLSWIEIRSPGLDAPRPSVFGGTGAKGTNPVCVDWKCKSFGGHRFKPGPMQVFTVTSGSLVSQSEVEYFPRFHSHVLEVPAA